MSDGIYHFSFGDFSCIVFQDALDSRPLEFLTTSVSTQEVSKALETIGLPADQVFLSYNILMLDRDGERTLIDAGLMHIGERQGKLVGWLREVGIQPESIQNVIITHTDFDHVGGLISADGDLFYPNAQIWMTRDGWDWYHREDVLAKFDPGVAAFFRKLFPIIAGRVEFVAGDQEIIPGVRAIPTPGHRPGHIALSIDSQGQTLIHFGDAINNPIFIFHPDWLAKIDTNPEQGREVRKELIQRAADEKALIFAAHPPFPGLGRIAHTGAGYAWSYVGDVD